jgi:hypothetical protein
MIKLIYFIGNLFCRNKVKYNVVISVKYDEDSSESIFPIDNIIRGVKFMVKPMIGEKYYFDDDGPFYTIVNISHRIIGGKHEIWVTVDEII